MDFDIHIAAVVALGFVVVNITFHNTVGVIKHQAVVVRKPEAWSLKPEAIGNVCIFELKPNCDHIICYINEFTVVNLFSPNSLKM